ncbi:LacI family DNA-binding transcriptional regulator [Streptomyces sp. NPDC006332]|uniref:LacI family DNA-binding transcriptional regulator n=1 Tax=Streptomyces sp. NPDC006332 TaxID=3155456 RepID=UPI0033B7B722
MGKRRIGIKDVAAAAGVSVTTVSHILNEVEGARIHPETRDRVLKAADELGYRPNGLARGLRLRRSGTVGFVSDEIATTPFAGRLILGAQEEAARHGLVLLLVNTGGSHDLERRGIDLLLERQVEGVLYAAMYHRQVELPQQLRQVPTVILDAQSTGADVPSVVPDERQGGHTAVRELIAHGHRRIGFATNVDDIPATRGRLAGYRAALLEAGLPWDPSLVVAGASDARGGYDVALDLLDRPDRPTALFCFNDRMAMGAYRAADDLGLSIPGEVSVVGFDNQELICEGVYPALTTVALPHYEMGVRAVRLLLGLIEPPTGAAASAEQETLPCPLVARASVASPPGS